MVFMLEVTYTEILSTLELKYIKTSITRYTLPPGVYEISNKNLMLKSLLLDEGKVSITIDDIRLRSNLGRNETNRLTRKSFFYTILGFTQKQSGPKLKNLFN